MANQYFPNGVESFLGSVLQTSWTGDTIRVAGVRGYTFNSAHIYLSDLTGAGGSIVATDALANKTASLGVLDANDSSLGAVAAGAAIPALVIYKDTGTATTSKLLFYYDTGTGLPVTPNGATISVVYDNGVNRIAKFG